MITPDQLKVDDLVEFTPPLNRVYPGPWIVTSIGFDMCDIINGKGQVTHFGLGRTREKMLEENIIHLNRLRRVSKLDKLLLFYDHFYGEQS